MRDNEDLNVVEKRNIIKNCESMKKPRGFCEIVELSTTKKSQKKKLILKDNLLKHMFFSLA